MVLCFRFFIFCGFLLPEWNFAVCDSHSVQVVTLGSAINDLENAGEVNVKLSMHNMDKTGGSSSFTCAVQKPVCFVLDPPKESKRKKAEYVWGKGRSLQKHVVKVSKRSCFWNRGERVKNWASLQSLPPAGKRFSYNVWGQAGHHQAEDF